MPYLPQLDQTISLQSTAPSVIAFGFRASRVSVINDGGVPIYLQMRSTANAASSDHEIKGGEARDFFDVPALSGLSLVTTSTSVVRARVFALGGMFPGV